MKLLILLLVLLQIYAQYYTSDEIETMCDEGKADTNPPDDISGKETIEKINSLNGEVYMEKYVNGHDTTFDYIERWEYVRDLAGYATCLYLALMAVIIWIMYASCMICKCCYCIVGPATKLPTRSQKIFPVMLMVVFGLVGMVAVPYGMYYTK